MEVRVVAVIPARGGSKGIKKKNIRNFCGKPLIAWTIEAANKNTSIEKVVVSTEDPEISQIAQKFGAEVPFIRPYELSKDSSTGVDVALHAAKLLQNFDLMIYLQPTSPMRSYKDIDSALKFFEISNIDSLVTVKAVSEHPDLMVSVDKNGNGKWLLRKKFEKRNRQEFENYHMLNGSMYIVNIKKFLKEKSFYCGKSKFFVMETEKSIDIDNELDWMIGEMLFKNMV